MLPYQAGPPASAATNTLAVTVAHSADTAHGMEAYGEMGPGSASTSSSSSPCQEGDCNGGICAKVLYLLNLYSKPHQGRICPCCILYSVPVVSCIVNLTRTKQNLLRCENYTSRCENYTSHSQRKYLATYNHANICNLHGK